MQANVTVCNNACVSENLHYNQYMTTQMTLNFPQRYNVFCGFRDIHTNQVSNPEFYMTIETDSDPAWYFGYFHQSDYMANISFQKVD